VRREASCEYVEPALLGDQVALSQDTYLDTVRACATVEALLAKLDDEKRTIFVLYELEGLTMAEVAGAVGCPLQTAYSRLHAARRAVKVLLLRSRLVLAHAS
jgi:RNA polymerase sigma-70 factor (ECF subfamily)